MRNTKTFWKQKESHTRCGSPLEYDELYGTYMAKALKPPSTTATVPVTNFAASDIR